jgi:hypothetical protein
MLCDVTMDAENSVTFQIALVGCDGIVVGSDQRSAISLTVNGLTCTQTVNQRKFWISDDGSIACFASGQALVVNLAQDIASKCNPEGLTELQWINAVREIAADATITYPTPDSILILRRDTINAFWSLQRRAVGTPDEIAAGHGHINTRVDKMNQHFCIGAAMAQFLPCHLWEPTMTIAQLKTLALLTLSYAAEESSSSIGAPFDIVTIDSQHGFQSSVIEHPTHRPFQERFRQFFAATEIQT